MPGPSQPDPTQTILDQLHTLPVDTLEDHYHTLISFIGAINPDNKPFDPLVLTKTDPPLGIVQSTKTAWKNLKKVGVELAKRQLTKRKTFAAEKVEEMKEFFVNNALAEENKRLGCIDTLNKGLRILYGNRRMKVGSEIQTTMQKMKTAGKVIKRVAIEFLDANGRVTKGVKRPEELKDSVWGKIMELTGEEYGWSVFGLSLMDGYHSIALSIDNTIPVHPHLYWSDQWQSHAGWWQYDTALDKKITSLTQTWWERLPANRKHRTRVTIWRLRP